MSSGETRRHKIQTQKKKRKKDHKSEKQSFTAEFPIVQYLYNGLEFTVPSSLFSFLPSGVAQQTFLLRLPSHLHSAPQHLISHWCESSPAYYVRPHHPSTVPPVNRSTPSQSARSGFTSKTSNKPKQLCCSNHFVHFTFILAKSLFHLFRPVCTCFFASFPPSPLLWTVDLKHLLCSNLCSVIHLSTSHSHLTCLQILPLQGVAPPQPPPPHHTVREESGPKSFVQLILDLS